MAEGLDHKSDVSQEIQDGDVVRHGVCGGGLTVMAGSPEYSILMFPQKQPPVGILEVEGVWWWW